MPRRAASIPAGCRSPHWPPASRGATISLLSIPSSAALDGSGTLRGQGRIPLGVAGTAGSWSLDVRDVDLKRLYAPLVATRVTGKLIAELDLQRQRIRGDVADRTITGGLALDFAAVVADGAVVVERFRARSGKGELAGRGRLALSGERAFELDATTQRFDPASYGAFPAGALDGRIVATGTLAPAWRVHADIALAAGSHLSGVALAGTARGTLRARAPSAMPRSILPSASRGSRQRAAQAKRTIVSPLRSTRRVWPNSRPCSLPAWTQLALGRAPCQGNARRTAASGRHRSRRRGERPEAPRWHRLRHTRRARSCRAGKHGRRSR